MRQFFEWERDYAPLWSPGDRAFWLEPEPHEIRAGEWPMPFTAQRDLPVYDREECEWYHKGHRVVAFNWRRRPDGHTIVYADYRIPPSFISDFQMGLCSGRPSVRGYLGRAFYLEQDRPHDPACHRPPVRNLRRDRRALASCLLTPLRLLRPAFAQAR